MNRRGTIAYAADTLRLLSRKRITRKHFQVLHSGYLLDLLEGIQKGNIPDRDVVRTVFGLPRIKYVIRVNMRNTPKQMIDDGAFDNVAPEVLPQLRLWRRYTEKCEVHIGELLHVNAAVTTAGVLASVRKCTDYRCATAREVLAFAHQYPHVQRQFPVVAIDTERPCYLAVHAVAGRRTLQLILKDEADKWEGDYRFLIVRNR